MMQTSNDVLDALANRLGTPDKPASDYRIARELDVTTQRISSIRHGRIFLSKSMAITASKLLEVEPAALIAIATAERETDQTVKESLLRIARASLAVSIALCVSAAPQLAAGTAAAAQCILCKVRRARRRRRANRAYPGLISARLAKPRRRPLSSPQRQYGDIEGARSCA